MDRNRFRRPRNKKYSDRYADWKLDNPNPEKEYRPNDGGVRKISKWDDETIELPNEYVIKIEKKLIKWANNEVAPAWKIQVLNSRGQKVDGLQTDSESDVERTVEKFKKKYGDGAIGESLKYLD